MATIKDIARALNISTSTVSYALNGGPRQVPERVREQVLATARDLNYKPNRLARSLVTGQSGALGIVAGNNHHLLSILAAQARSAGEDLLLVAPPKNATPETIAYGLMDGRIDGVLFVEEAPPLTVLEMLAEQQLPYVLLGVDGPGITVRAEIGEGVIDALEHLAGLGHTRIASVTGSLKSPAAREQAEVFSEFAREHELELIPEFLGEAAPNFEGGYEVGKRLLSLQARPTAVLAGCEESAFGLCHAFRDGGLELPRDISVVGVGDSTMARSFVPPLTTISIPHEEMAAAALGALWMMCRSSETAESQTFPTKLVERGSTARPSRAPVTLKKFDRERLRHLS